MRQQSPAYAGLLGGDPATWSEHQEQARDRVLKEAEAAREEGLAVAMEGGTRGALIKLQEHIVELKQSREWELRSVLTALLRDTPSLVEGGFTSGGHFYECPNGHPYVIGECGGAMQASRCPECGARIGGGSHTLASGNRVAAALRTMAQDVAARLRQGA